MMLCCCGCSGLVLLLCAPPSWWTLYVRNKTATDQSLTDGFAVVFNGFRVCFFSLQVPSSKTLANMADYMAHTLVSDANKDVLRLSEMIEEVRL